MSGFLAKAACLVVVIFGARAMSSFLSVILLGILLAYSLSPVPIWLIRKRLPAPAAIAAAVLAAIAVGAGAIALAGASIVHLKERLPLYEERWVALRESVTAFLAGHGFETKDVFSLEFVGPDKLVGWAKALLLQGGQAAGQAFLLLLIMILALIEIVEIHRRKTRGELATDSFVGRFNVHSEDIRSYVSITGLTGLLGAVFFYIVLLAFGVESAATWAALSFLLNFIPTFGAIFTVVPPALLALLASGWLKAAGVIVAFTVINLLVDNVIKPRLMKDRLNISPLLVLVSLLFWTWVLGPLGAILAVPITITIKRVSGRKA
jgi:predicted PurR-regulated permease PerM